MPVRVWLHLGRSVSRSFKGDERVDTMEALAFGDSASLSKTIGEYDIHSFGRITGDFHPNHVNEQYMAKTRSGKRVAHGALTIGYVSAAAWRLASVGGSDVYLFVSIAGHILRTAHRPWGSPRRLHVGRGLQVRGSEAGLRSVSYGWDRIRFVKAVCIADKLLASGTR